MSRSYKKYIKIGNCCGQNTEFYRERNRQERTKNRNYLRHLISNYDIDMIEDLIIHILVPYDDWLEPTDGHFLVLNENKIDDDKYNDEFHKKISRYIRNPKHNEIIHRRKLKYKK